MSIYNKVLIYLILIMFYLFSIIEARPLQGVRFGQYETFSRVVFDLYQNELYHILIDNIPYKVVLEFPQIQHLPDKTLWSAKSNTVESVRFVAGSVGIQAEITLRQPGRVQKHFQLDTPDRVVVDIVGKEGAEEAPPAISPLGSQPLQTQPIPTTVTEASEHSQHLTSSDVPAPSQSIAAPRHRNAPPKAGASQHSQPMSAKQLLKKAELEWNAKQYDAAQLSYQTFLARFPKHEQNHLIAIRLADILRDQKQYRMALDAYAKVGVHYPNTEGALVSKIRMVELRMKLPELIPASMAKSEKQYLPYYAPLPTLHQIVQDYPFHSLSHVARYTIGQLQLGRNDVSGALETFQRLLDHKLTVSLSSNVERKLRDTLGIIFNNYILEDGYLKVLTKFFEVKTKFKSSNAMHPDLILPVAESYANLGLQDEAEHLLKLLLEAGQLSSYDRQKTILQYAKSLFKGDKSKEASTLLLPLDQFSDEVMHRRARRLFGEIAVRDHKPDNAMPYLEPIETLYETASERAQIYTRVAKVYEKRGQTEKAMQAYQKCVEASQDENSKYLFTAEVCLFRTGNLQVSQNLYQRAIATCNLLLKEFPETRYRDRVLFLQADVYRHLKDETLMLESLRTLRDTTSESFWKKIATEYLDDKSWKNTFNNYITNF